MSTPGGAICPKGSICLHPGFMHHLLSSAGFLWICQKSPGRAPLLHKSFPQYFWVLRKVSAQHRNQPLSGMTEQSLLQFPPFLLHTVPFPAHSSSHNKSNPKTQMASLLISSPISASRADILADVSLPCPRALRVVTLKSRLKQNTFPCAAVIHSHPAFWMSSTHVHTPLSHLSHAGWPVSFAFKMFLQLSCCTQAMQKARKANEEDEGKHDRALRILYFCGVVKNTRFAIGS